MAAYSPGQATFSVDSLLFDPLALPRPSDRRTILGFLLVLAALIHFGSIGWGQLYDGPESWNATVQGENITGNPDVQTSAPLLRLVLMGTYRFFGFNDWAARIPMAAASVALVWLVFLIAERLGGTWRGFSAGVTLLCCPGMFIQGRTVSAEPIGAALICAAIYCAIRGFRLRKRRRWWFMGVWLLASLATLAVGAIGWMLPIGTFGLVAVLYTDSRIRARTLFSLEGLFLFLLVQSPWLYSDPHRPIFAALQVGPNVDAGLFRAFLWIFPWSIFLLVGTLSTARLLLRYGRLEFRDGVAWVFLACSILLFLVAGGSADAASPLVWAPASLVVAATWANLLRKGQIALMITVLVAVIPLSFAAEWTVIPRIQELSSVPNEVWPWFRWLVQIFSVGMAFFAVTALVFTVTRHQRLPILALAAATLPLGFALLELRAKLAPYFSSAEVAEFLNNQAMIDATVVYPGDPLDISSLRIYSDRTPVFIQGGSRWEPPTDKIIYLICARGTDRNWPHFHLVFQGTRFSVLCNTPPDNVR